MNIRLELGESRVDIPTNASLKGTESFSVSAAHWRRHCNCSGYDSFLQKRVQVIQDIRSSYWNVKL